MSKRKQKCRQQLAQGLEFAAREEVVSKHAVFESSLSFLQMSNQVLGGCRGRQCRGRSNCTRECDDEVVKMCLNECSSADNDWDKDWNSAAEKKVSPNMPRPTSRSGSASSLRGKAGTAGGAAKDTTGPNGGSWAGWDEDHDTAPTTAGNLLLHDAASTTAATQCSPDH